MQLFPSRARRALVLTLGLIALSIAGSPVHAQIAAQTNGPRIDVAFSPEGGAEQLVLSAINAAHSSIRLSAYSFTSGPVVQALLAAKRERHVDVAAVIDYKSNISEDRSGKAKAALNLLVNAGIPTRLINVYPIHHDKFIIVDGLHVETGSFNYSAAAAHSNSENVVVLWNRPDVAAAYLAHWTSRWSQGTAYTSSY
jgi:phosphatidylserine/phosphatidylglycerophosphate/cardiolipin synthase-like enzyme